MSYHGDYWSVGPCGDDSYVIEGREGELLIGDQLPSTMVEARLLCRCANRAHEVAVELCRQRVQTKVAEAFVP